MARDLGDFQTPPELVKDILQAIGPVGKKWSRVIEPTCGLGNFIEGLLSLDIPPCEIQAFEIQKTHVRRVRKTAKRYPKIPVTVQKANIFKLNFQQDLRWKTTGPLLVIGNPPWVTSSELGSLGSNNLPLKTNIKGLRGIDAITGGSNFDIAEYIWLKLIKELIPEKPTIALLCKTTVARNVLQFAFNAALPIASAFIRRIDAQKYFGVAADACLFCVEIGSGEISYETPVYPDLYTSEPETIMGIVNGRLVADLKAYQQSAFVEGHSSYTWRQGLKHDAATIMELTHTEKGFYNKLGEIVSIEPDNIYPLLKGSDLFRETYTHPERSVIVTQKRLGEDTLKLKKTSPRLWVYLTKHARIFKQRGSSIYRNHPPFSMFGIGDYSFSPYKVAIPGFYKIPRFRAVGPVNGRPVMFDDTCYFIPCYTAEQAVLLVSLLNDPVCIRFIHAAVFWDSKRPITKKLLQRIDLSSILEHVDQQLLMTRINKELNLLGTTKTIRGSSVLDRILIEGLQTREQPVLC